MYELERNMDDIFNSINYETIETEKTTEKRVGGMVRQGSVIKAMQ